MELGHLNIPKPEIERFSYVDNVQARLYLQYSALIENSEIGKQVLSALKADPKVQGLDGQMISNGSCSSRFELKVLAMWFLWAINEFGQKSAEENLNIFLDSSNIPVINTLWILGVEVAECIQLSHGLVLVPITEMPNSREKEYYLKTVVGVAGHQQPRPCSAITLETKITKSFKVDEDFASIFEKNKELVDSSKLLYDASLVLNAIENISCIPYLSTEYTLPQMPIGLFGGSSCGTPLHDVIGQRVTKITPDMADEISSVISSFLALPDRENIRFSRVLSRLSQSKRREQIEDKILDLGIALEMALLDDNKNLHQLSLSFRLRGSWLIASDESERLSIYRQLRDIYNYRSQVAHSGALCGNDTNKIRDAYNGFSNVAERIIKKLICEEKPDWSKLILGIT